MAYASDVRVRLRKSRFECFFNSLHRTLKNRGWCVEITVLGGSSESLSIFARWVATATAFCSSKEEIGSSTYTYLTHLYDSALSSTSWRMARKKHQTKMFSSPRET